MLLLLVKVFLNPQKKTFNTLSKFIKQKYHVLKQHIVNVFY